MASRGVNKVIIIGNLGNDPETRFFPSGDAVTDISVATSESWRDKTTGEQKEKTEWHRISLRDRGGYKLGQIAGQYLKKGSKVYIEGRLETRKWQDQQGQDRYTTEIIADQMQMLDSRAAGSGGEQEAPASFPKAAPRPGPAASAAPQANAQPDNFDNFDDDIPF